MLRNKLQKESSSNASWLMHVQSLLCPGPRTLRGFGLVVFILLILCVTAWPQAQHSIKVSWTYTQGADTAVGFNVYRGTVSGGPYTKQTAAPLSIASLSYSDLTGTGGTKYYYVITAVDAIGIESPNSSEASATFLAQPLAPQGVTAVAQ